MYADCNVVSTDKSGMTLEMNFVRRGVVRRENTTLVGIPL